MSVPISLPKIKTTLTSGFLFDPCPPSGELKTDLITLTKRLKYDIVYPVNINLFGRMAKRNQGSLQGGGVCLPTQTT